MTLASLIFSGRDWLVPVLVLAGVGALALAWGYARAEADRGLRAACALLKVLGFSPTGEIRSDLLSGKIPLRIWLWQPSPSSPPSRP